MSAHHQNILVKNAAEIVTCSGHCAKKGAAEMNNLSILRNGYVIIHSGQIVCVIGEVTIGGEPKSERRLLPSWRDKLPPISHSSSSALSLFQELGLVEDEFVVVDGQGCCVLPGFVDSHTHFVFGGFREDEFFWRLNGVPYMEIMHRGGGILSTSTATQKESFDSLTERGKSLLDDMLSQGITTVEGKSGYGLDKETELKQLRVMKRLNEIHPIDIVPTFCGAHAVPPPYKGKPDEYLDFLEKEVMPIVVEEGLAEFCDIFCEKNVFEIPQSRRHLLKGQSMGLPSKFHADEIVPIGGSELAAEIKAVSADHLLQASDAGIKGLAANGVICTLLPSTAYTLREPYAKGRQMIDSGCAVALATDLNPGSCFSGSIPLLLSLAALQMRMTPEEIVTAITINGAAALNRAHTIGSIDPGKKGDVILLKYPSYKFLVYRTGVNIVTKVIKSGQIVWDAQGSFMSKKS